MLGNRFLRLGSRMTMLCYVCDTFHLLKTLFKFVIKARLSNVLYLPFDFMAINEILALLNYFRLPKDVMSNNILCILF